MIRMRVRSLWFAGWGCFFVSSWSRLFLSFFLSLLFFFFFLLCVPPASSFIFISPVHLSSIEGNFSALNWAREILLTHLLVYWA